MNVTRLGSRVCTAGVFAAASVARLHPAGPSSLQAAGIGAGLGRGEALRVAEADLPGWAAQ